MSWILKKLLGLSLIDGSKLCPTHDLHHNNMQAMNWNEITGILYYIVNTLLSIPKEKSSQAILNMATISYYMSLVMPTEHNTRVNDLMITVTNLPKIMNY